MGSAPFRRMEWFQVPPEPAAQTEVVPWRMTAEEARALTDQAREQARELWWTLLRLYEGGAHTALGYSSWAHYFNAEFRQSEPGDRLDPKHPYRLLRAARVEAEVSVHVDTEGMREAHARVLAPLAPAAREEVARRVAEEGGFGAVSAGRVRQIRDEVAGVRRLSEGRLVWDERALRGAASAVLRVGRLAGAFADVDGLRELPAEEAADVRAVIAGALADVGRARRATQDATATLEEAARVLDDRGDVPAPPPESPQTTARDIIERIRDS
jgi:hypothetical protein